VIRSFGNIKGLLTFTEIKEAKKNIRAGTVVKAYVLFNKKKTGLALTFDKKKANKSVKDKKIVVTD
jgi:predicted RNA-binding protein (virulence factor B family)